MTTEIFKYTFTGGYVVLVYWLSWIGMRKTKDISGFAIGNKDMSPYLIGITLAASIASTATFVGAGPGSTAGSAAVNVTVAINANKLVNGRDIAESSFGIESVVLAPSPATGFVAESAAFTRRRRRG